MPSRIAIEARDPSAAECMTRGGPHLVWQFVPPRLAFCRAASRQTRHDPAGQHIHFPKRLFQRRLGDVEHLPGNALPYFCQTISYSSIFKCMTESGMPKRWLSVTRRLSIWMKVPGDVARASAGLESSWGFGDHLRPSSSIVAVIGRHFSSFCQWPQLRPASLDLYRASSARRINRATSSPGFELRHAQAARDLERLVL